MVINSFDTTCTTSFSTLVLFITSSSARRYDRGILLTTFSGLSGGVSTGLNVLGRISTGTEDREIHDDIALIPALAQHSSLGI